MLTRYAPGGAVAAANHLAATAGVVALSRGGNAADAAVAAGAVMAVVAPHMCGLGGDLFAIVAWPDEAPTALNASGRSGAGADAGAVRREGLRAMPFQRDIRAVTVPGCVDGLVALHERYGSLSLADLLAPARRLASDGFPAPAALAWASAGLRGADRAAAFGTTAPLVAGQRIRLAGVDRALGAIAAAGRAGFYEGEAGASLLALGDGHFHEDDLRASQADWVQPLRLAALGRQIWTVPPNSQGYLALAGAWIAEHAGVPADPEAETWAPLLVEAARRAAFDRPAVLHEDADGAALIDVTRLGPLADAARDAVRGQAGGDLADVYQAGGTTHICAVDRQRAGVSLIMSNAADFGSHLVLPRHGIFLHNRGMGFSLEPGHPAEFGPGRRPPHTLSPLTVTDTAGTLDTVLGTMGGDAQPQILLQVLTRLLAARQPAGEAVAAPRWALSREPTNGFDVWQSDNPLVVRVESDAPPIWSRALRQRGYQVIEEPAGDDFFGHAQVIRVTEDGQLAGAADPRSGDGAFAGL
ncbi:MAG TPA: gamma-glutamyltransferase [Streptosporangiaceae bacterium]